MQIKYLSIDTENANNGPSNHKFSILMAMLAAIIGWNLTCSREINVQARDVTDSHIGDVYLHQPPQALVGTQARD